MYGIYSYSSIKGDHKLQVIHEFENLSVARSSKGIFYIDHKEHGQKILFLPSPGSKDYDAEVRWIASPERVEADFLKYLKA